MKIPISKTSFTQEEFKAVLKPLETGWVVQGPYVQEFEKKWCNFTGAKHSIAVTNCTTALHLSLAALKIGYGDEVIVPSFTWIATANSVESSGAKPVFCDIIQNTFNIDYTKLENLINNKTKAIIPVHLFGLSADMDPIIEIANRHKLFIIEDAACGFASKYKGVHTGNFGNAGCFSFHPRKALTTGEGGMITTNDDVLASKLRSMRDHGASISDHQRHFGNKPYLLSDYPYLGFNYRMTDIQASLGSSQMDRAVKIYEERKRIADAYNSALKSIEWLKLPYQNEHYVHGYQAYVCLFAPKEITIQNAESIKNERNKFMEYLQENGISTRPGTHAVHLQMYYVRKYNIKSIDFPVSYISDSCSVAFPLYCGMQDEEINFVIEKIKTYSL
jgi:dTDP-4-amino-4,6-dideoxygalactose transaminase